MRDYVEIGSGPANEEIARIGIDDDAPMRNRAECKALIGQLRRIVGDEPFGASLGIRPNSHEFGVYYDVVCYYDDTLKSTSASVDYAYKCEGNLPLKWDEQAIAELKAAGFSPK